MDRAASLMHDLLVHLATLPDERSRALARWLLARGGYDPDQLRCDEALAVLGLDRIGGQL